MFTRRQFLRTALLTPLALKLGPQWVHADAPGALKEALFYKKLDEKMKTVYCELCPRACTLSDGELGFCRARKNISGRLYSLGYAQPCAAHIDPIEKKPFYNMLPKSLSFSIASAGCNLRCQFCQNWQISQVSPLQTKNQYAPPETIVSLAKSKGCMTIAYTYTEPTNFFEYMIETAKLAKKGGILNVQHSNGYINPGPLKELCKYLDAANIDLKGFNPAFYRTYCEAELNPVLETIKTLKKSGVWVELTNLVIAGHNDDPKMITTMCNWVNTNLGADTPVHFSRFFPMYKMTAVPPTPVSTLERAREIGLKAGLHYPYVGNVPGHPGENTYCPNCKKMIIKRAGYSILEINVGNGKCKFCGHKIGGIWTV
jgi:pyruvate formate lyase activating enzyme